ncbi:hypothetical protein Tco_0178007 [Tanacetum coccineum]
MVNVIPPDHDDDVPVVEPNQHDDVPVVLEPVLEDEDEDPEEDKIKEEEDPQEDEDDMEIDIEEDENEPELTYPYEEVDPLSSLPPITPSNLQRNGIQHWGVLHNTSSRVTNELRIRLSMRMRLFLLVSMRSNGQFFFSRRLCGREMAHALVEKKGEAKDRFYGKLILDLGNEVRSSVEQGTAAMEKLVEKLENVKEKAEYKKLKKELE